MVFMESKSFTREIKTPANKKEGLENFIQMIINRLESNETREGLLLAVDLLEDVRCGIYNDVDTGNLVAALHAELDAKHLEQLAKERDGAFAAGQEAVRAEISKRLGLVA
jgi:hypothetical protein